MAERLGDSREHPLSEPEDDSDEEVKQEEKIPERKIVRAKRKFKTEPTKTVTTKSPAKRPTRAAAAKKTVIDESSDENSDD